MLATGILLKLCSIMVMDTLVILVACEPVSLTEVGYLAPDYMGSSRGVARIYRVRRHYRGVGEGGQGGQLPPHF